MVTCFQNSEGTLEKKTCNENIVPLQILLLVAAKCSQDVTDGQLKESDIIKITVEKKETTKTVGQNKAYNLSKPPLTIVPLSHLKTKPVRHTSAPVNMVNFDGPKGPGNYQQPTAEPTKAVDEYEEIKPVETMTNIPEEIVEFQMEEGSSEILDYNKPVEYNKYELETAEESRGSFADRNLQIDHSNTTVAEELENSTADALSEESNNNSSLDTPATETNVTLIMARNESESIESNVEEAFDFAANGTTARLPTFVMEDAEVETTTIRESESEEYEKLCGHSGNGRLQYVWGDAFEDTDCLGPNMQRYPSLVMYFISFFNSIGIGCLWGLAFQNFGLQKCDPKGRHVYQPFQPL